MPWARASSLRRFMACGAASWLPRWDDSKGTIKRPYLTDEIPTACNTSLLRVRSKVAADRGRQRHAEKERGEFFPEGYEGTGTGWHEVSFSYCCATGKVWWLADVDERRRDLWKALQCSHAVVGTADWCGILPDGTLWVDDLKTGWAQQTVLTEQTMFYAMCLRDLVDRGVSRWAGANPGEVAVSITHQPRGAGAPSRKGLWRRATPVMLESFRLDLTEAWRVTMMDRRAKAGGHCQWCPSAPWCPAQTAGGV